VPGMLRVLLYTGIGAFACKGWNTAAIGFAIFMNMSQHILWNSDIGIFFLYNIALRF
jgi:hypothetical protein